MKFVDFTKFVIRKSYFLTQQILHKIDNRNNYVKKLIIWIIQDNNSISYEYINS